MKKDKLTELEYFIRHGETRSNPYIVAFIVAWELFSEFVSRVYNKIRKI